MENCKWWQNCFFFGKLSLEAKNAVFVLYWTLIRRVCIEYVATLTSAVLLCVHRSHSGHRLICERCDGGLVLAPWKHWWDWRGQCQTQSAAGSETRGTSPTNLSSSLSSYGYHFWPAWSCLGKVRVENMTQSHDLRCAGHCGFDLI